MASYYWNYVMDTGHLDILRKALSQREVTKKEPDWQLVSAIPYRVSLALRCVELGDTKGLAIWLNEIGNQRSPEFDIEYGPIVEAANRLLKTWSDLEATHGPGALLDYQHRLKSSPPDIVGIGAIANAIRFQEINPRVPGDRYWSLQFG
jgi:hypothetical protein